MTNNRHKTNWITMIRLITDNYMPVIKRVKFLIGDDGASKHMPAVG